MKIGLYGIEGLYNFGCEAIVRGTAELIWKIDPRIEIYYFSLRSSEDIPRLKDIPVHIVPVKRSKSIVKRGTNRILRMLGIDRRILLEDIIKKCADMDLIFSIGGDLYTIPKYRIGEKKLDRYNKLICFGDQIQPQKRLIIWGASIGPFGEDSNVIEYYKRHLKKACHIFVRERRSFEYLNNLGIQNNLSFFPDPAFFVMGNLEAEGKEVEKRYIGINLSPLSVKEIYGEITENVLKDLASLIEQVYLITHTPILMIPHVISPINSDDNDLDFQRRLLNYVDKTIKEKIRFAGHEDGFLGIKHSICECRFVIAARMHCAINALTECVPTIFLIYSSKSMGMAEYIYGSDRWTVGLDDLQSFGDKVYEMNQSYPQIKNYLGKRLKELYETDGLDGYLRLKRIIKGAGNYEWQ